MRILARLAKDGPDGPSLVRLCVVCAEVTATTGAGITLMADGQLRGSIGSSDRVSSNLQGLQDVLGEGPCVDAYQGDRPVLEPDLARPAAVRWVAFAPPAGAAGAGAVFAFPISIGGVRLGVMNLYRDRPGPLSVEQHADALVMAGVTARVVIGLQAAAPPGSLGTELEIGMRVRFVVHQAAGMISAQLDVGITEAMIRLRALAFSTDRLIEAVAVDVVERRLRFTDADE